MEETAEAVQLTTEDKDLEKAQCDVYGQTLEGFDAEQCKALVDVT